MKTSIIIVALLTLLSLSGCVAPGDPFEYAPEQVTREDATRAGMESVRTFSHGSLGASSVRTP